MNSHRRKATEGGLSRGAAEQHGTVAIERGTGDAPLRDRFVVDTSALLAAAFAEPQRDAVLVTLSEAEVVRTSAACLLEGSIVAFARLGAQGQAEFGLLLDAFGVEVVSLTPELAVFAAETWERWGKGRHPAGLNIVDCCSYALAAQSGEPLLAVGDDFARTDLRLVELPALA